VLIKTSLLYYEEDSCLCFLDLRGLIRIDHHRRRSSHESGRSAKGTRLPEKEEKKQAVNSDGSPAAPPTPLGAANWPVPPESVAAFDSWPFTLASRTSRHHSPSDSPLVCAAASNCAYSCSSLTLNETDGFRAQVGFTVCGWLLRRFQVKLSFLWNQQVRRR
jgi:hypothetical protein